LSVSLRNTLYTVILLLCCAARYRELFTTAEDEQEETKGNISNMEEWLSLLKGAKTIKGSKNSKDITKRS
jgi:ferritin-like metal-binding protein YciE